MPHFLSWVVISGLVITILSPTSGPVNALLEKLGVEPIFFLSNKRLFRGILVLSDIWRSVGWQSIIYLAAISSINPELYEAATVDGALKWQKIRFITLPGIKEIIAILLILRVGRILDENFQQILNLYNAAVYEVADVYETYVYRVGILQAEFSFAAAVGFFKSICALILIYLSNKAAKRLGTQGLW
jgi:putative aldouronate transport system permease protein